MGLFVLQQVCVYIEYVWLVVWFGNGELQLVQGIFVYWYGGQYQYVGFGDVVEVVDNGFGYVVGDWYQFGYLVVGCVLCVGGIYVDVFGVLVFVSECRVCRVVCQVWLISWFLFLVMMCVWLCVIRWVRVLSECLLVFCLCGVMNNVLLVIRLYQDRCWWCMLFCWLVVNLNQVLNGSVCSWWQQFFLVVLCVSGVILCGLVLLVCLLRWVCVFRCVVSLVCDVLLFLLLGVDS